MFLFIVNDQIVLHKIFYVAFCFMKKKKQSDYVWILKQLKRLYQQLQLSDSTVLLTNVKKDKRLLDLISLKLIIDSKRSYEWLSSSFSQIKSFIMSLIY
jgi:hypothetical protein